MFRFIVFVLCSRADAALFSLRRGGLRRPLRATSATISSLRTPFLRSASAVKRWYSTSSSLLGQLESQILAALVQRVPAAVLAQHQLALGHADRLCGSMIS